jgi:SNF2 family DNA or RNA helicase
MMIVTEAGGEGINLQKASKVVFLDHAWNPNMDLQAAVNIIEIIEYYRIREYYRNIEY